MVDPSLPFSERDPVLVGPVFTEDAFTSILAEELKRLYVATQPEQLDRAWRPAFADLDAIRALLVETGRRLVLVVYPSRLQVDPALREALVLKLRTRPPYATLSPGDIDPLLPNTRLAAYCRSRHIPCFDLTSRLAEASQEAGEPLYKERDAHWTIRGNRVAAEAEAAYLAGLVCSAGT